MSKAEREIAELLTEIRDDQRGEAAARRRAYDEAAAHLRQIIRWQQITLAVLFLMFTITLAAVLFVIFTPRG